jgi:hypothetical protein
MPKVVREVGNNPECDVDLQEQPQQMLRFDDLIGIVGPFCKPNVYPGRSILQCLRDPEVMRLVAL